MMKKSNSKALNDTSLGLGGASADQKIMVAQAQQSYTINPTPEGSLLADEMKQLFRLSV
jgi:hypothetical protein